MSTPLIDVPSTEFGQLRSPVPVEIRERLRAEVRALSFHAFEQCIRDLLYRLGYTEVRLLGRTEWRQRTAHGGLDMTASSTTGVTRTRIALQVKQYERPVSRRFVDELRGTMGRTNATHGLIVTTSGFSQVARKAATADPSLPIRLVNGEELLDLLCQANLGIQQQDADPQGWTMDETYFQHLTAAFPGTGRRSGAATISPGSDPTTLDCRLPSGAIHVTHPKGDHMLWRTHVLAGITSLWLLKPSGAMTSGNILLLVSLAAFGSLLPDLDARESKAKWLEIGGVAPLAPVAVVANGLWGHRGFLHSPVALILLALPLALVSRWWGWPFAVALWLGYGSHLLLDGCTRSGISAWPRTDARIHFLPARLRFVTGSMAEDAVFVVLAIAVLHLLFRYIA